MENDRDLTGESEPRRYKPNYSDEPQGLPWPASKLSAQDLHRLGLIRHAVKKPLTLLLKEAVQLLWDATQEERDADERRIEAFMLEHRAKLEESMKDKGRKPKQNRTIPMAESGNDESPHTMAPIESQSLDAVAEPSLKPRANDGTGFDS